MTRYEWLLVAVAAAGGFIGELTAQQGGGGNRRGAGWAAWNNGGPQWCRAQEVGRNRPRCTNRGYPVGRRRGWQAAGRGRGPGARGMGLGRRNGQGQGPGWRQNSQPSRLRSCVQLDLADRKTTREIPAEYLSRLQATLGQELFARDYYRAAAAVNDLPRFSNLARAEQNHVDAITVAIGFLGGKAVLEPVPDIAVPKSLSEADAACRDIEQHVIEVYAGLIEDCPDPELLPLLQRIQAANHRHLRVTGG